MKLSTDRPPKASSTSHTNATPVSLEETRRAYYVMLDAAHPSTWMLRIIDLLNSQIIRYWTLSAAPRRDTDLVLEEHRSLHEVVTTGTT